MKKIIIICAVAITINSCATVANKTTPDSSQQTETVTPDTNTAATESSNDKSTEPKKIIGGLAAPIYFQNYDQNMIDNIANVHTAKKIIISYPTKLKPLAIQINDGIIAKSQVPVQMHEVNLQDTDTVKYRHDVVIVTLDFRQ